MTYGSTTPDAIAYLTSGSSVNPVTESSTQATSIQTAFSNRPFYNYAWTSAAARTAQTGMRVGDLGFQQDTGVAYQYINSSIGWQGATTGVGKMLSGNVLITGLVTKTQATAPTTYYQGTSAITFPTGFFSATPNIVTVAGTTGPQSVNTAAAAFSSTGFTIYLTRTDSAANTTVFWTAML